MEYQSFWGNLAGLQGWVGQMNCPYCAEQIKDSAIVCKHCRRDLFVIRPLMEKLAEATKRVEAFEAAYPVGDQPVPVIVSRQMQPAHRLPSIEPLAAMAMTFILLVVAHYIIIVDYNLPLIFLRVVSIVMPLGFGFLCRESERYPLVFEFICGVVVAVLSILVMSTIVGKLDNVPVLPRNLYEWKEFAEYGASIAFGFFTGVIARQTVIAMTAPQIQPHWAIGLLSKAVSEKLGGPEAGFNVKTIQTIISTGTAIGSAVTSVVTGLSQFF
jgi:hypothetical protein